MKKLRITVNGKDYDVSVQVLEDDEQVVEDAEPVHGASLGGAGPIREHFADPRRF